MGWGGVKRLIFDVTEITGFLKKAFFGVLGGVGGLHVSRNSRFVDEEGFYTPPSGGGGQKRGTKRWGKSLLPQGNVGGSRFKSTIFISTKLDHIKERRVIFLGSPSKLLKKWSLTPSDGH